jgi:predicted helicase
MSDHNPVSVYISKINAALAKGNATEPTHYPALKQLIEALGQEITATVNPQQIACGAPDLVVSQKSIPIGHIEAKDVGKSLDQAEKTEQIERYLEGLPNLILTNYQDFRWYQDGEFRLSASLDLRSGEGAKEIRNLLTEFLKSRIKTLRSPQDLAKRMAGMARLMRQAIAGAFKAEDRGGELHNQLKGFRQVLIQDLSEEQFADMYAQTICYGLFAARCNHTGKEPFNRVKAAHELPKTNPFLREIFGHIAGPDLDERVTWIVDDLAELLDRASIADILRDFGKRTRQEDPVVHFYETFLAEYDPDLREMRGVYYTPEPIVRYIVKSVDVILKRYFKIEDGLADASKAKVSKTLAGGRTDAHRVTILDPAAGTGTFPREVISRIRDHIVQSGQKGAWNSYVSQHLLPRLFGFELMMAPYAVCHMKLGLQLAETGYDFRVNERLRVYLTNSLEEAHKLSGLPLFAEQLAREAAEAGEAKQDYPVMVVLGNPPYSGHSANKGEWMNNLLRGYDTIAKQTTANYFECDGKSLGERNPKWLNDDYVKFIRFAQWRIEHTGYGVLAFITNHGYLDNPTFRGMRQALMETFDDIYILDLHGNSKKKEKAPDGGKDENVFDIQQGVAIGIFVKRKNGKKTVPARVYHADLWGTRETWGGPKDDQQLMSGKYHWLSAHDVTTTKWEKLNPETPNYLFIPQNTKLLKEYQAGWKVTDIMPINVLGFQSHRDQFAIAFSRELLKKRLEDMADSKISDQEFANIYDVKDNRDWNLTAARRKASSLKDPGDVIIKCNYRPFDTRYCIFSDIAMDYPRTELVNHVAGKSNICINLVRQTKMDAWSHALVSNRPPPPFMSN